MNPISIDIYDETVVRFIAQRCKKTGKSPTEVITDYLKEHIDVNEDGQTDVDRIIASLKFQYKQAYMERFGVPPIDENGETARLMYTFIEPMLAQITDIDKILSILKKAIKWYLYFHDNTDAQGQAFPYGLKYLFTDKQNRWLIRSCIESAKKIDDKVFLLMAEKKLTKEEALRTIRRGDEGAVGKQESVAELVQDAFKLLMTIKAKNPDLAKKMRETPGMKPLFQSTAPSREHVTVIIEKLRKVVDKLTDEPTTNIQQ